MIPTFYEGAAICKEGGMPRVTIENKGCWIGITGVNAPVAGNYPAILGITNSKTVCELTFKNSANMCVRRMKAQVHQTVTLKNLAGELEVKLALTNMEDETLNTSCFGGVSGRVAHLDEYKGEFKIPRINVSAA